jgi:two-component system sensor histidine kinase AlgZ
LENAVAHGIAHLLDGGMISLSATKNGSALILRVANPCDAERQSSKSTSVGLTNVRKRLETLYGNDARMTIENGAELFRVEIVLPERFGV